MPGDPACGNAGGSGPGDCYGGWIHLGREGGTPDYSLQIALDGGLSGYAWSSEFGWFRFMGKINLLPVAQIGPQSWCDINASPTLRLLPRKTNTNREPFVTSTISWACENVVSCYLKSEEINPPTPPPKKTDDPVPVSGSGLKELDTTTKYTISCSSGVVNDSVTVKVLYPSQIIECNPNSPTCK